MNKSIKYYIRSRSSTNLAFFPFFSNQSLPLGMDRSSFSEKQIHKGRDTCIFLENVETSLLKVYQILFKPLYRLDNERIYKAVWPLSRDIQYDGEWRLVNRKTMNNNAVSTNTGKTSEKTKVKVAQSCPTLQDLMEYTRIPVHGILQARILEWVAFPFSRGLSQPRDQTHVSHIARGFFTSWATGKPKNTGVDSLALLQRIFLTLCFY